MAKNSDWNQVLQENKNKAKEEFDAKELELGVDQLIDLDPSRKLLEELNSKHIYIETIGGKPAVTQYTLDEITEKEEIEFLPIDTFKAKYQNQFAISIKTERTIGAGQWWLENPGRKSKRGVIFDPSQNEKWKDYLNLWQGFNVEPKQGSWKHTRKHIWKILSNKNKDKFKYLVKWLAWTVQNPHERAEVAVILTGKKGAGKSFLFTQIVKMFGQHGMAITDKSRLAGKYSSHFRSLCFLFGDEVYYPGEREIEGRIKAMITEPYLDTEAKFQNPVTTKNRLHIAMCTNNDWVVSTGEDERRYYINRVSDDFVINRCSKHERREYFTRLWSEMHNGGREAMLYDLLRIDVKNWHPRFDIPDTEEIERQKLLSLTLLHQAFKIFLEEGLFPGEFSNSEYKVSASAMAAYLEEIEPNTKNFTAVRRADILKSIGAVKRRSNTGTIWVVPDITKCRENWCDKYGHNDWDELDKWQIMKTSF